MTDIFVADITLQSAPGMCKYK